MYWEEFRTVLCEPTCSFQARVVSYKMLLQTWKLCIDMDSTALPRVATLCRERQTFWRNGAPFGMQPINPIKLNDAPGRCIIPAYEATTLRGLFTSRALFFSKVVVPVPSISILSCSCRTSRPARGASHSSVERQSAVLRIGCVSCFM